MPTTSQAIQAYRATNRFRSQREQEADVFRTVTAALKTARNGSAIQQVRALADNRRLWTMVVDLMADPRNALPEPLRASIMSVGMTVQREMDGDDPNFEFLISINENIAAGLAGQP
nr:flagellar biosynthesis regulator FlaF [uncultured Rhodopila sp.]